MSARSPGLHSVPGDVPLIRHRPFPAPHHTISPAGLVGGGQWPRPGETHACGGAGVSLAHRRVLFLAEPQFSRQCRSSASMVWMEVLRQPLEDKIVTISHTQGNLTFLANFMLVAHKTGVLVVIGATRNTPARAAPC